MVGHTHGYNPGMMASVERAHSHQTERTNMLCRKTGPGGQLGPQDESGSVEGHWGHWINADGVEDNGKGSNGDRSDGDGDVNMPG